MLPAPGLVALVSAARPFTFFDYLPVGVVAVVLAALAVALVATMRRKDAD